MVRVWGRHLLLVILTTEGRKDPAIFSLQKSALGSLLKTLVVGVWMFLILSDYKLDCFRKKSPTSVGLFMDKKSMMRNRVED